MMTLQRLNRWSAVRQLSTIMVADWDCGAIESDGWRMVSRLRCLYASVNQHDETSG